MGRLLHRVGSATAGRPLLTILVWLLLVGAAVGTFSALQKPLTPKFVVPNSEFSSVLQDLSKKIPAAAGGVGTVALHSEQPFTAQQQQAVARTIEDWKKIDHVKGASDPFVLQKQLDDNAKKLQEGRAELQKGRVEFDRGNNQLAQARGLVAAGQKTIDQAREAEDPNLAKLEKAQIALEKQLQEGEKKLAEGQTRLTEGQQQLTTGQGLLQLASGTRFVSSDGRTAVVQVMFDVQATDLPPGPLEKVQEVGKELNQAGVQVEFGQDISHPTEVGGISEIIGVAAAAVVLLIMLGSFVLAGMPLAVALIGVGVSLPLALSVSHWVELQSVTPILGLMLGLAVGIDYGLFIVNRHRMHLGALVADRAEPPTKAEIRDSIARATGTAGVAVTVAGSTVLIALAALVVTRIPSMAQMGLIGATSIGITVVVALTLTPALLALAGARAVPKPRREPRGTRGGWPERWYATVVKRPAVTVTAVVVALCILALPALTLRLGLPDGGQDPEGSTSNTAYTMIEKAFGPGTNGPIIAVADVEQAIPEKDVQRTQLDLGRQLGTQPYVRDVLPIGVSADRKTLAFQVIPVSGPSDERTVEMVGELRGPVRDHLADTGVKLGITGATAANIEVSQKLAASLPLYLVIVVGMSLVLLTLVFRSVVVPLVATGGYLLSAAASFGAVVAVYQWGWLGPLFGVTSPGAVVSFLPIILIGVLFGLAMDYQMFLVSGMHEAYQKGRSARRSVRIGFVSGARVVTAAALIMICVFTSFIFAPMTMAKPVGLGLAAGVAFDAFLVRMMLTPAVMVMLGDRAWYLPAWLDRRLPHVDVEGTKVDEQDADRPKADALV
jgi:RND superfamily putative drug exporter